MTNNNYQNKSFMRTVRGLRKIMPYLGVALLITVYVVSAIAEGSFLSKFMDRAWLAFSIAAAIQATRALLVFFNQLNPNRPSFNYSGEAIAVIMGLISIGSIWGLVNAANLPYQVGTSLGVLMLAGMGVEIFLLREIRYITEQEIYSSPEALQGIKNYYTEKRKLESFLDDIRDEQPTPLPQPKASKPEPKPAPKPKPEKVVDFPLELSLNGHSSNGNGTHA